MKLHLALALAFFLLQVPGNPAATQQTGRASIEGTVTRSGSGEPLERAQVTLNRILPPPAPPAPGQPAAPITPPPPIAPVLTQNDGKFRFEVDPGQYRLRVQRNGFATQEYGQRVMGGAGTTLNLTAGQAMRDVQFKMTPAAIVTGRVRDSRGDPITGAQVSLLRSVYSVLGQRTLTSSAAGVTDDRGEYRIFWVPAGRYILSVGAQSSSLVLLGLVSQTFFVDRSFPTTYYPGTSEASRAVTLDIQPGREVTGIDVVVNPPQTYRIRGKVVDGTTGQPPRNAGLNLIPRQDVGTSDILFLPAALGNSTTYNPNGTFEIRNVVPGPYWLRAQGASNLDEPINPNVVANARTASDLLDTVLGVRMAAQIPVDVTGDLEGIALTLTPGVSVQMRLNVEGQDLSSVGGYDRIRVNLRPSVQGSPAPFQRSPFSVEGIGTLDNIQPGDYRVQIGLVQQPDLYLKEANFERTDVLNNSWQITSRTSGTLTIVLSNRAGQTEGNLTDALSQPVSGSQVVLIPDQMRDRSELFKTAVTDQNGHFSFRGIAPGGYKLFSWEAIEPNAWYDREFLSQYEQQGRPVRIQEGSKENVDVKVIPAPKQ